MIKSWTDDAWEDFCYWQNQDKKTLKRILKLIKDIDRNGYKGLGKPEPLGENLSGYWSRRIDDCNRIVYKVENDTIKIVAFRCLVWISHLKPTRKSYRIVNMKS